MWKFIDVTGSRFGKLTVIKRLENGTGKNKSTYTRWLCQCDCGNKVIHSRGNLRKMERLNYGSCGCDRNTKISENKKIHGLKNSRLYSIWCSMKTRCYNKKSAAYKNYGGRGIEICKEWLNDFMSFYNWSIENGYEEKLTIDRIDNNGNYEPNNCRWATRKEQNNNTRKNRKYEYEGKLMTIKQLSEEYEVNYKLLKDRLTKLNWDIEKAINQPKRRIEK